MIAKGLCSVLASDYYYPAQLLAAFRLAADGVLPLAEAWQLISSAPARAAGLTDRGVLAAGRRADIILVDDEDAAAAACRRASSPRDALVHLTEADRLQRSGGRVRATAVAAALTRAAIPADMCRISALRDLLCPGARQRPRSLRRALLGYDAFRRRRPAVSGRRSPGRAGLARPDRRSPQIRLSRHAEGAVLAGARTGPRPNCVAACAAFAATPRAIPVIRPVVGSISGFIAVIPAEPHAGIDPACRRLRQRIRSVPRAAHRSGPCAPQPSQLTPAPARASRSLGISLRVRRVPLPHDTNGSARRGATRDRSGDAAESLFGSSASRRSRSTGIALFRQDKANARFRIVGRYGLEQA